MIDAGDKRPYKQKGEKMAVEENETTINVYVPADLAFEPKQASQAIFYVRTNFGKGKNPVRLYGVNGEKIEWESSSPRDIPSYLELAKIDNKRAIESHCSSNPGVVLDFDLETGRIYEKAILNAESFQ
jgi:hypothetical protein